MKWLRLRLLALLAVATPMHAQVSVQVELDQEQYLVRESIIAAVRIVNFSGQTLRLGRSPDWLTFDVEAADGSYLHKLGDPPVVHEFEVPNSARATRRVNLTPWFELNKLGRYKVIATVRIPELSQEITSSPGYLNLTGGALLWQQPFGWRPRVEGQPGPTEIRHYSLVQAMNRQHATLYVRISDEYDNQILRVEPLGQLLGFSRPEPQIDRASRLHVLWQTGARTFSYNQIDPEGQLLLRRTYQYASNRPRLRTGEDGEVRVVGGSPISQPNDFPPREDEVISPAELPPVSPVPNPPAVPPQPRP